MHAGEIVRASIEIAHQPAHSAPNFDTKYIDYFQPIQPAQETLEIKTHNQTSQQAIMSDKTFGVTSEDIRKAESKEAQFNDGKTPKDSDVSAMKVRLSIPRHLTDDVNTL